MDIEHLGEKVAEQLVESGLVGRISDIYLLDQEVLSELEGFKEKSVENLLKSIEASKNCPLSRLIMGLGISQVGSEAAELLAEAAEDLETLQEMNIEGFDTIEGIGEKTAEIIYDFFQDEDNREEIKLLLAHGVKPQKQKKLLGHEFSGKSFVLTGSLSLIHI